jgi:streptogramin lyase
MVQGTPNSSRFAVVLKPNGQPADGRGGMPKSPLLGGGYGVSIAPNGLVWFGNFGWGLPRFMPTAEGNGSISLFSKNGRPISGNLGFQGGPIRAQAVVPDTDDNIWIASFGNDRVYVFPKGNPRRSIFFQQPTGSGPFDIQIADDGTAWVSNSGGLKPNGDGSIARYALKHGRLHQVFFTGQGHSNKAVALDSQGETWMASGGDNLVYHVGRNGHVLGRYNGGGIDAPWGITVDGDDNVWVGNFGPEEPGNIFTTSNISKQAGNNPDTHPPGKKVGDPISPGTGYTLPNAGSEILLHNGEPLYGPHAPASYTPLMRITSVVIDRAGNIWATNNWKPDFTDDLVNSGGDGICIFVGLAKPLARKRRFGHRH